MSIGLKIVDILTGGVLSTITDLGKSYINKEISLAEYESRVKLALTEAATEVEKSWSEASTAQFESFQQTLRSSPAIQRAYVVALVTQLFVLFWYQWGSSAFLLITGKPWPNPGATVEWAYLLLGAMLGAGPLIYGRGASVIGELADKIKSKK